MEYLNSIWGIIILISLLLVIYLIIKIKLMMIKIDTLNKTNSICLESMEKYVEIFNAQNITELQDSNYINRKKEANKQINLIKKDFQKKFSAGQSQLSEEQVILVDFVTVTLSLLIKIPPNLRAKILNDITPNEVIKKIISTRLYSIQNHYIPISMLEIAISEENEKV